LDPEAEFSLFTSAFRSRDRCYDFLKYFCQTKLAKILAFVTQNNAKVCKHLIITLVCEKNADFFRRKLL
jgi:hypothetical protein